MWTAVPDSAEPSLWQPSCASFCAFPGDCGGAPTAPCAGAFDVSPEGDTGNSPLSESESHAVRTFDEGLALRDVRLESYSAPRLPLFIPLYTDALPLGLELPFGFVGATAKQLFGRPRKDQSIGSRLRGRSPDKLRRHLRVSPRTNIVGILNGSDRLLEGFWGMARSDFFQHAHQANVALFTGPTYSVTTEIGVRVAGHNVAALRRHHRIIQELSDHGLSAIPNLYWRTERDLDEWVDWLNDQPHLFAVSRDFSRSKLGGLFDLHMSGVIDIVRRVRRPLHVLLVGVGLSKAEHALQRVTEAGAICSFAMASPVLRARSGGERLHIAARGKPEYVKDYSHTGADLIVPNLQTAEEHLLGLVRDWPEYSHFTANLLPYQE